MLCVFPRVLLRLLCAAVACTGLHAAVIHVAPGGSPGADGSERAPFGSVQAALDRAGAGDTVRLRAGVYRERVAFKNGGRHGAPVTLEGEPGAILDGSYEVTLDWQPAPDVAPGTWRAKVDQPVRVLVAEGKSVTMLRDDWVRVGKARHGEQWEYPNLFHNGVGPSGWEAVRALALYRFKERELLVRFQGDLDPRTMDIAVGPVAENPIVEINGVDRCVVRGLTLRNAGGGVRIQRSLGSVVEDCVIGPVDEGVRLRAGADRATIRFNEIFWNPYGENRPKAPGSWDHWTAHKRGGWSDKHAISIWGSAGGHEIHDNLIRNHWDGISVGPGDREDDPGLRVHHNRISTLVDDGIETNGAQVDCRWHDNLIEGTLCAIRLKAPDYGPFYVYRNILLDNKEDLRNFGRKDNTHRLNPKTGEWETRHVGRGSPEILPAVAYIYHNTGTANAAIVSNGVYGIGVPNYHYFNNLFWCETWFSAVPRANPSIDPNWKGDHNVYFRRGDSPRWAGGEAMAHRLGLDLHGVFAEGSPGFTDIAAGDVSLADESPAHGRGADLSWLFGEPLPGCEPGYFEGAAPDAGAVAHGRPMPRIPRPRSDVSVPPAGTWPAADAVRSQVNTNKPPAAAVWERD